MIYNYSYRIFPEKKKRFPTVYCILHTAIPKDDVIFAVLNVTKQFNIADQLIAGADIAADLINVIETTRSMEQANELEIHFVTLFSVH